MSGTTAASSLVSTTPSSHRLRGSACSMASSAHGPALDAGPATGGVWVRLIFSVTLSSPSTRDSAGGGRPAARAARRGCRTLYPIARSWKGRRPIAGADKLLSATVAVDTRPEWYCPPRRLDLAQTRRDAPGGRAISTLFGPRHRGRGGHRGRRRRRRRPRCRAAARAGQPDSVSLDERQRDTYTRAVGLGRRQRLADLRLRQRAHALQPRWQLRPPFRVKWKYAARTCSVPRRASSTGICYFNTMHGLTPATRHAETGKVIWTYRTPG